MKDGEELTRLFRRYLANECSKEEAKGLFESLTADERQTLFLQLIEDNLNADIEDSIRDQPHIREVLQEARKNIGERIGETQSPELNPSGGRWFWSIRVAALLFCVCAVTFFFFRIGKKIVDEPAAPVKVADIGPGGSKAILTLADGSRISLTDAGQGTLVMQQGVSVTKSADGQIIYKMQASQNTDRNHAESSFNTITTPRGGQYTVVLPDGTKIWLNAASSISYPVKFGTEQRRVVLQGEAYFEVARVEREKEGSGKVPFIVETGDQEVQVLGTHFNVNGYADEPVVKTSLLEGKVRVSQKGGGSVVLVPGQQSRTSSELKNIKILNADIKAELAWKNNQFFFEDEPIETIMRQISRWYDVEVVYRDDLKDKTVWGSITRFSSISKVLNILELTGNVHFKIEGRKVIVMK